MIGIFYILFFWLLGTLTARLTGDFVPGSVVGMLLLFLALRLHIVRADAVRSAARFLLRNMALFFVPYGVGLMVSYPAILHNFWAIAVAGIASTVLVMAVTGRLFQRLHRS